LTTDYDDRPRVGLILIGCLVGFLGGQIVAALLVLLAVQVTHFPGGLPALTRLSEPPWWSNVLGLVGLWVGFGGAIYFATMHGHLRALAHQWRLRASDGLYVLIGVACQAIVALAYYPFHLKSLDRPVSHLFGGAHGAAFVFLGVLTTLVAPFMEEWFFRGVLFRSLHEGLMRIAPRIATVGGVLASACLFALAHGEPLQFAGLAFLGVVLAIILYRTQRLMPCVITHASFNAVAMVALLAQRSGH
jgi:membrane protease YdiL (CAAX protease family)